MQFLPDNTQICLNNRSRTSRARNLSWGGEYYTTTNLTEQSGGRRSLQPQQYCNFGRQWEPKALEKHMMKITSNRSWL